MTIGEKLVEARKAEGLSRSEAARRLGVFPPTLKAWEFGMSVPEAHRSEDLATFLHTSKTDVLRMLGILGPHEEITTVEITEAQHRVRKTRATATLSSDPGA